MNGNGHVFGVEAGMRICGWVHVCKIGVHVLTHVIRLACRTPYTINMC